MDEVLESLKEQIEALSEEERVILRESVRWVDPKPLHPAVESGESPQSSPLFSVRATYCNAVRLHAEIDYEKCEALFRDLATTLTWQEHLARQGKRLDVNHRLLNEEVSDHASFVNIDLITVPEPEDDPMAFSPLDLSGQLLRELLAGNARWDEQFALLETALPRMVQYLCDNLDRSLMAVIRNLFLQAHEAAKTKDDVVRVSTIKEMGLEEVPAYGLLKRIGRPTDTGYFKNEDDFLLALREVCEGLTKRPSQLTLLMRLDRHKLCQRPPKSGKERTQGDTKLLRAWLQKVGLTFDEALAAYFKQGKNRG